MRKFSLKPVLFMIALTFVYTAVLASINAVTAERIQLNENLVEQTAILSVLNMLPENRDPDQINVLYRRHIRELNLNDRVLYEGLNSAGERIAYIVPFHGKALWGELTGVAAFTPDFSTILGIDFIKHMETPGLGGRIDELSFKEQFRGVKINPEAEGDFLVYRPRPGGQVDAIAGATGTSNAVLRILNDTLAALLFDSGEALLHE
ncbi:MAG: FMN-binding protein [Firmicutes bacterium]|nr:FMN-binding protein [Bacillota bacterium]